MSEQISSALVNDLIRKIDCDDDRQLLETFIRGILNDNERLRFELREEKQKNEGKSKLTIKVKAFALIVSICIVFVDAVVFPLINHYTLLNNPNAVPITSKIGELVKLIAPMF